MGKRNTTKDAILNILTQQNGTPLNYKQICSRLSIQDPSGRNHIAKSFISLSLLIVLIFTFLSILLIKPDNTFPGPISIN